MMNYFPFLYFTLFLSLKRQRVGGKSQNKRTKLKRWLDNARSNCGRHCQHIYQSENKWDNSHHLLQAKQSQEWHISCVRVHNGCQASQMFGVCNGRHGRRLLLHAKDVRVHFNGQKLLQLSNKLSFCWESWNSHQSSTSTM